MPSYDAQGFDPPAPVARVTLRTEGTRKSINNVPMLIDSGADLSLIPRSCADHLGLQPDQKEDYELTAFDGTTSVAKSVQCDLIFLGRAYRGAYLVVDDTKGILGRDVLNHVSIVLDGPHLAWREEHTAE